MLYTKTIPQKWTNEDIKLLNELKEKGYAIKDIANILNRTEVSISIKLKRLKKKNNTYNVDHIEEKYKINNEFIEELQPKTMLDLYSGGVQKHYKNIKITTNDINKEFNTDYNMDALKLICKLYSENKKYDYIDLDPFGSAYDCIDLAVKMSKKGISITLGELGHKRWKRLDYVRTHYGINNFEDFTIEKIIKEIQQIGRRNKKELIVYKYKEWKNIGRVWFKILPIKITEQWN